MNDLIKLFILPISMILSWQIPFAANPNEQIQNHIIPEQWVQDNIDDIHKMTRKDWLNISEELSMPVYIAFTPQQKQAFWIDKINEVIALEGWEATEKEHIQKLITFIRNNPEAFYDQINGSDNYSEFNLFLKDWTEYATSTLGWSNDTIAAIVGKGNVMVNKAGELIPLNSYNIKINQLEY